ncbi:MAG: hypothetical protein JW982_10060 [Spirochaetes bacterium]|nr:hypothetical protein [Spirochaetota bacterium]
MDYNNYCDNYMNAFFEDGKIAGSSFSFRSQFDFTKLNYTKSSIKYVEKILDSIYENYVSTGNMNTTQQELSNLVHFIGFYIGLSISKITKKTVDFYSLEAFMEKFPYMADEVKDKRDVSFIAVCKSDNDRQTIFYPLAFVISIIGNGYDENESIYKNALSAIESIKGRG